jgi:hypothetical protein
MAYHRQVRPPIQAGIVIAAIAAGVVPVAPAAVERYFSTWTYPMVQRAVTPVSNLAPIALFDLLTLGAAIALVVTLVRTWRAARPGRRIRVAAQAFSRIATAAAAAYLVFLALWGFNYRRTPMGERLVMANAAPTTEAVIALGLQAATNLNVLHGEAHAIGWGTEPRHDASMLHAFDRVQRRLSAAEPAVPGRLKWTIYGPYFRWTSVDGMVNPFALEVLANPDLLPFELPFVAAHEWAHLAGYAHEAEANFVGWLTCVGADAPAQYSAWQYLYWQVSGEVSAEARRQLRDALDDGPRRDLDAVVERVRRGQLPMLRSASWAVYDHYLRANRVEEGVRSYGEVVTLLLRARFEDGWSPVRRRESFR